MSRANHRAPDFIGIGPSKTGTNTLCACLEEHPRVGLVNHVKGTRFFDRFYERGWNWYLQTFPEYPPSIVVGEITETYFQHRLVPERLQRHLPDVKIITVLRNPVDRAFAEYLQLSRLGLMTGTFEEALKAHDNLTRDNFYYDHLSRYRQRFRPEQMLVLLFDDLQRDGAAFIRRVFEFLGVDATFTPEALRRPLNPAALPRLRIINRLAFRTMWLLRRLDLLALLGMAKNSPLVRRILFKPPRAGEAPAMAPATRAYLQQLFQEQVEKCEALLGRDLSQWK